MCLNAYRHKQLNTHTPARVYWVRCQERQSGDTECKKTLQRPGLSPGPRWGKLTALSQTPYCWGGRLTDHLQLPFPNLGPSGLASSVPHFKIVPLSASTWCRLVTPLNPISAMTEIWHSCILSSCLPARCLDCEYISNGPLVLGSVLQ